MLIFFGTNCFSQEKYALISGKIISSNKAVSDVHIINLNTKMGTISNDRGEFEIRVSLNDTLLFSSIEYERKKIKMTGNFIKYKRILVDLIPSLNELYEIFIEGLTGSLNYDINKVPKDTLQKHNFIFKRSDVSILGHDYNADLSKPPNAEALSNPILMNGVGGSVSIPDKRFEQERRFKQKISQKKEFPLKIKKDLGLDFFTKVLNIPEEKINNFLAYCEYKNIIEEYYRNNLLQVIQILQEESESYNTLKN